MFKAVAYFETEHARKYLTQLCKHFAHKIEVTYDQDHGDCRFPRGAGRLVSDDRGLRMEVTAPEEDDLARTQSIIEVHLIRFAFREKLEALAWQRLPETA